MHRLLLFVFMVFLGAGSPAQASSLWGATLYLGPSTAGAPYDPGSGFVTYSLPSAPSVLTLRGAWPGVASVYVGATEYRISLVVGASTTTVTFPAGVAGQPATVTIPWNAPVISGKSDADYTSGGYFYDSSAKIAYTVTWPDFCGAAWPCPDDDAVRLKWDVVPPAGSTGYWLAEDSRGTYTDPFHVSWAWFESGAKATTASGYTVVGRPDLLAPMTDALDSRDIYIDTVGAILGARPYSNYGYVDTGDWGETGEAGGMEHTPYAFIDSTDGINYPTLAEHEYIHAWYSGYIGYPHVGEMIVGEGVATYIETIARAMLDGGLDSAVAGACRLVLAQSRRAPYPAWVPDGANIAPPDMFGYALPYYAGMLQLVDISAGELGDPYALGPVLGDIAQDLPPGAYSWEDVLAEVEIRTGANIQPYMGWVTSNRSAAMKAARCDVL